MIISGNFSDLHTAAPRIVTRPWPNWFLFSFNIPPELALLSASWNKTSKSGRRKSRKTPHSAGKHKKSAERSAKGAPLWGCRKVKIINVDSIEALHAHKGGKTLHFGSADPHGVINSFKGAEIKSEQHGSGQGERRLSVRQTGLAPARAFSPASLLSTNTRIFPNCSACLTIISVLFGVCSNAVLKLFIIQAGKWQSESKTNIQQIKLNIMWPVIGSCWILNFKSW